MFSFKKANFIDVWSIFMCPICIGVRNGFDLIFGFVGAAVSAKHHCMPKIIFWCQVFKKTIVPASATKKKRIPKVFSCTVIHYDDDRRLHISSLFLVMAHAHTFTISVLILFGRPAKNENQKRIRKSPEKNIYSYTTFMTDKMYIYV